MNSSDVPRTYLDHAASSTLRPGARAAMVSALAIGGNPSSVHAGGRRAKAALEDAREQVAEALGALPGEVLFTSGGSESDSIAVLSGMAARAAERPRLVVGATEHVAVAGAAERWARLTKAPVDGDGVVSASDLALDGDVGLVSVMAVNNETGTMQPIADLAEQAHRAGAWFHTDAVQAIGHVPFHFGHSGADLASASAHKFGGPVGSGVLLVRRGLTLPPYGLGGRQEGGVRSGTQSLALATGFAAAAAEAVAEQAAEFERLGLLRRRLVDTVRSTIDKAWVNGGEQVSPTIANFTFTGTRADDILLLLDQAGIDASTGSACHAGVHQPSEVLLAMGRTAEQASSSVRFSFGATTRAADIDALVSVLPDVVSRARAALVAAR